MSLTARQVSLYTHTIVIWRNTETFAGDGKPTAWTWQPSGGYGVSTTVTSGTASATQTVGSTTGMSAGDTLYFVTAATTRVIESVTNSTTVVLTATVTTTTSEKVTKVVSCYGDIGKSQQGPNGVLMVENDNLFTFDEFHMEDTMDVNVGDVIKMITGPEAGEFWMVRGNAQIKNRRANMLKVLCSRTPTAPNGVS